MCDKSGASANNPGAALKAGLVGYIFATLALVASVCTACLTFAQITQIQAESSRENARRAAIAEGKRSVDELYAELQARWGKSSIAARQNLARKLIAERNKRGAMLYAIDISGIYISHYNPYFIGYNAFFERDTKGRFYMRELLSAAPRGSYTEAKIPWSGRTRHIITYAVRDAASQVIFGSTIELSSVYELADHSFSKFNKTLYLLALIIGATICGIIICTRKYC